MRQGAQGLIRRLCDQQAATEAPLKIVEQEPQEVLPPDPRLADSRFSKLTRIAIMPCCSAESR